MSQKSNKSGAQRVIDFLASPEIFFYTALWMIVLLIFGTVDQKYIGLYLSQYKYFSSWFVWGIFPGGRLTMTVMFINLLTKLVFKSPLRWDRFGTLVTHSGMLLLLLGGFFTAYFSKEGAMSIFEGDSSAFFEDFHDLEIAVIDKSPVDHDSVTAFSNDYIAEGAVLSDPDIPFTIGVETFYRNVDLKQREGTVAEDLRGAAQRFELVETDLKLEHGPYGTDGLTHVGRVGDQVDQDFAYEAARQTGLAILSTLKAQLGSLDRIQRVVKLLGLVNSTADFYGHPAVINGCSELFAEVFGEEAGIGTRSAFGVAALPGNITVEIEGIVEVE